MKKALITGATGFIGHHLCHHLTSRGWAIRAVTRGASRAPGIGEVVQASLETVADWDALVRGVDVVIHLAARVHRIVEDAADPLDAYRRVNVEATRQLAQAASRCGVARFVFLSTVKVCGEGGHRPYRDGDPANPCDPYSLSKWEAEQALAAIAGQGGLQVVVLRPPLVYGPGVKANFLRLMRLVDRGIPMPLASVRNARSMIYVGNLTDAIAACAASSTMAGGTFLLADPQAPSTPQLIRSIAAHMGRPARLWPMPVNWLRWVGRRLARGTEVERLVSSLVVSPDKIQQSIGWQPLYGFDEAMTTTVQWYRQARR